MTQSISSNPLPWFKSEFTSKRSFGPNLLQSFPKRGFDDGMILERENKRLRINICVHKVGNSSEYMIQLPTRKWL